MIPEEPVVDAIRSEHLAAAELLVQLANRDLLSIRAVLLDDFAGEQSISLQKLNTVLQSLIDAGLLARTHDSIVLASAGNDALRYAAVLRGVAYARYRQHDANQVEIMLSPPAHPSRLMEVLPKQGFA